MVVATATRMATWTMIKSTVRCHGLQRCRGQLPLDLVRSPVITDIIIVSDVAVLGRPYFKWDSPGSCREGDAVVNVGRCHSRQHSASQQSEASPHISHSHKRNQRGPSHPTRTRYFCSIPPHMTRSTSLAMIDPAWTNPFGLPVTLVSGRYVIQATENKLRQTTSPL